ILSPNRYVEELSDQWHRFAKLHSRGFKRMLEVTDTLLARFGAVPSEALGHDLRHGVKGSALKELLAGALDPQMGHGRDSRAKLLDQARLADSGLADREHCLALALACAFPAGQQQAHLLVASDELRHRAGIRAIRPAA